MDHDREFEAEVWEWNNDTRRKEKVIKRAKGYARYKAIVCDGMGGRATGTKTERAVDFLDYVEKAETGSIGRALAALGYGTQFCGDEFDEQHRIVDSPVAHETTGAGAQDEKLAGSGEAKGDQVDPKSPVTAQQMSSIGKLCRDLNKQVARPANYGAAKELIAQLAKEHRENRSKAS